MPSTGNHKMFLLALFKWFKYIWTSCGFVVHFSQKITANGIKRAASKCKEMVLWKRTVHCLGYGDKAVQLTNCSSLNSTD